MNLSRYERQIKVIGSAGQDRLGGSSVFIVGCGGLGCPIAIYLAASGVGNITIIDDDVVSLTNLHRQIIFKESDIGLPKVAVAKKYLSDLNSEVNIFAIKDRLNKDNSKKYLEGVDLVVVGCDNYATRYDVNDACSKLGQRLVNASVLGDEGNVSFFDMKNGCYACDFPEAPPSNSIPLPGDVGVLGSLAGVVGTMAATMAIEILIGNEINYVNKIFTFDSVSFRSAILPLEKNTFCKTCQF